MIKNSLRLIITVLLSVLIENASAQELHVFVTEAQTADSIPLANAVYKGRKSVYATADSRGEFTIQRIDGETLDISAVGYKVRHLKVNANTPDTVHVTLLADTRKLQEVVVKAKRRTRYVRKNNPAVELMKRVIAAKKRSHLENYDYYQYNKYQKITFSLNDIKPADLDSSKFFKKRAYVKDQIETSPYNGKLILPVSVDETVTQHIYRKDPKVEKDIIKGQRSEGVNNVLQTGEILNTMLREVFTDVDIYDDHMRLLQYQFTSPIGETAISFYRFYIQDTVYVDRDLCYHLEFIPNNQQDFGFRGELYVLADSSLHVKRCSFTLPKKSDVNFVHDMKITQEYTKLPNGEWALSADDMAAELKLLGAEMLVTKATRYNDYAFDELPSKLFRGKAKTMHEADAMIRDDDFWAKYRTVELSHGESSMKAFIHRIEQSKNFKWILFGLRAFAENFVETGSMRTKSKFDIGPVTTIISNNFVDNWRFRLSGRTTANLCNHFFWNGYYAYSSFASIMNSDGYNVLSYNQAIEQRNYWRNPGDIAMNTRPQAGVSTGSSRTSTRYLYKKDLVRLQNVVFTYQLPRSLVNGWKLSNASVSLIADNLLAYSPYSGSDHNSYKTLMSGYPLERTFTLSLNVGF